MFSEVGATSSGSLTAERRDIPYDEYLQTEHWQQRRRDMLAQHWHKCQLCGERGRWLEVHHNSYDHLWHEPSEDLIVLCETCHQKHHSDDLHASYTGMVCPSCGTAWAIKVAIVEEVAE